MTGEHFAAAMIRLADALEANARETSRLADELARARGAPPSGSATVAQVGKVARDIRKIFEAFTDDDPKPRKRPT